MRYQQILNRILYHSIMLHYTALRLRASFWKLFNIRSDEISEAKFGFSTSVHVASGRNVNFMVM